MALAIFDLDNTLIAGDSDHAWGEFLVEIGAVDGTTYRKKNDCFYQAYQQGTLDMNEYLAFALAPLAAHDLDTLATWREQFIKTKIEPMRLAKSAELLQKHRDQSDQLLVITSTNRFIVAPICELLGVKEVIATEPEFVAGSYTGKVRGIPAYREGKVARLQAWLADNPFTLAGSSGYSDSINDLPLLEAVTYPVAVDADPQLLNVAQTRGWPCISLRE